VRPGLSSERSKPPRRRMFHSFSVPHDTIKKQDLQVTMKFGIINLNMA
jgi:hypothetical protein